MTKDQERKALERIAAILEETGKDSYLNITFAGVLEQAEENIANDFAGNYKEMYESALARIDEMNRDSAGDQKTILDLNEQIKTLTQFHEEKQKRIDELNQEVHDSAREIGEYIDRVFADQQKIETLEQEIITLKAKLYDLMTV